jgi:hypothetical protein
VLHGECTRGQADAEADALEQGFASPLPSFVKDELEGYLACGVLLRGFAILQCENAECRQKKLVASSCKGRGFCPSCMGRRMAETAANLVDHVLPRVPLRQFVFTVPFELRARLAYDGKLLGAVGRIFIDSVLGFYRRTMRDIWRAGREQSGAVTVVQRCSSDLRVNPHFHSIALDGVFVPVEGDELEFHALPSLANTDVAELMQTIRARVLAFLENRGVIESRREPVLLDAGSAEQEPGLATRRRRRDRPHPCRPTASADDARAREALCKYVLRPPLAQERLRLLEDGLVRIELKRPFSDSSALRRSGVPNVKL